MPPEVGTIAPEEDTMDEKNDSFNENAAATSNTDDKVNDIEEAVLANPSSDEQVEGGGDDEAQLIKSGTPSSTTPPKYPPSCFTNERGNLKAVAFVVRNPCLVFSSIIILCVVITFLLQLLVFRTADGSPFTAPSNEFDVNDERSMQYDSLRLAKDEVAESRKALEAGNTISLKQSELSAVAIWVFESGEGNDQGVFSSKESIEGMKEAYDLFLLDPKFKDQCWLDYRNKTIPDEQRQCQMPLTPLAMYYASEWDEDKVANVIEQFKDPEKMEQFNDIALCLVRGLYCDLLQDLIQNTSAEDIATITQLGADVDSITSKFDMQGELVENFNQVTGKSEFVLVCLVLICVQYEDSAIWLLHLAFILPLFDCLYTTCTNISYNHFSFIMTNHNNAHLPELASYLIQVDIFKGFVDYGFDTGFSSDNPISMYSRGIVYWGGPLETRNVSLTDEEANDEIRKSDRDARKDFVLDNYLEAMDVQADKSTHEEINSYYFMTAIIGDVILNIVQQDAMLALFSFAFIFFWLFVNTSSWFLAFVGLFEIFFSIPIAWFIFTVVFQINYFATLNALALFVVAAIGADDIFIFMDAYKQSQYHLDILTDLETRMSWVYRRTGTAMAITSATTCAAFLCTLITPLTSIRSFGIFAAVVIFIDYVLVMTLFCTAVVIYHNRYEKSAKFGCCCPCGLNDPSNTEKARLALEENDGDIKRDRVSEFFKTKVAGFIKVPLHRLVLCVVFLTWMGVAIWQATLIEATKESEQFLSEDNPLQKSLTILDREFPSADDDLGLKVYYAYGVDQVDRQGVNRLIDPDFFGEPKFVEEFVFDEQCQTDLLEFCDTLRTDPLYEDLIKRKSGLGLVYCFLEELGAYNIKGNLDDCDYVRQGDWKNATWQVDPSNLADIIPGFLQQRSCYDESGSDTIAGRYQNEIGWDGQNMRFAAVAAESAVLDPFGIDGESFTRAEYEQFIKIAEEQDKLAQSCNGGREVVMTDLDEKFVFMNNQSIYVRSAYQSAILGVAIAFVVLLISTRVFHLAFFASLSITCVLLSVVGVMVMIGWDLGSIESILIGIIAGFSVDYVVHLAHAYEIASGDTYDRITEAFSDLGISVFNGMITSVVASIPLFFCQLQFFAKFGTFICLTIAFSWIFANFGFMSLLAQLKIPINPNKKCSL